MQRSELKMTNPMRIIISRLGPESSETELQAWSVQLSVLSGGEETCDTHAPFTRRDLSIVLRALDVNRSATSAFAQEEVDRLREWGVVGGAVPDAAEGRVVLNEAGLDLRALLGLVQSHLYDTVFPTEESRRLLYSAITTTPLNEALHVQLQADSREVLVFQQPWEVLCYAGARRWFGRRVSLSRYVAHEQVCAGTTGRRTAARARHHLTAARIASRYEQRSRFNYQSDRC